MTNRPVTKKKQSAVVTGGVNSKKTKIDLTLSGAPASGESQRLLVPLRNNNSAVLKRTMLSYSTTLSVTGKCRDSDDRFAKGLCVSTIHLAVGKMLSNKVAIETYEHEHKFALQAQIDYLRSCGNDLSDPIKVTVNEYNIPKIHSALLDA